MTDTKSDFTRRRRPEITLQTPKKAWKREMNFKKECQQNMLTYNGNLLVV